MVINEGVTSVILRARFKELGWTQVALARCLGVSDRTVRDWLADARTVPIDRFPYYVAALGGRAGNKEAYAKARECVTRHSLAHAVELAELAAARAAKREEKRAAKIAAGRETRSLDVLERAAKRKATTQRLRDEEKQAKLLAQKTAREEKTRIVDEEKQAKVLAKKTAREEKTRLLDEAKQARALAREAARPAQARLAMKKLVVAEVKRIVARKDKAFRKEVKAAQYKAIQAKLRATVVKRS